MYAIVDIAGQQFKVEKGKKIFVHRLDEEEGNNIDFDKVLLIENDGKILVGEPHVKGAYIEGKVLEHTKGDKVIVFKKKRRKGYKVKKGHRQQYSQVEIISINEKGYVEKPAKPDVAKVDKPKATAKPVATAAKKPEAKIDLGKETAAPKATTAKKTTTARKTTAAQKPAAPTTATEKKPATKKTTTAKKPAGDSKVGTSKTAEKKSSAAKKTTTAKKSTAASKTGAAKPKAANKGDADKKADKK